MSDKRGRGRPPSHPNPPPKTWNESNNDSSNNYLSVSENIDFGDGNGQDGRGKKKNNDVCECWVCKDLRRLAIVDTDEIKSLQKSISKTKQDTNTILDKIAKLETYFLQ